jgi:hypothetical protein
MNQMLSQLRLTFSRSHAPSSRKEGLAWLMAASVIENSQRPVRHARIIAGMTLR